MDFRPPVILSCGIGTIEVIEQISQIFLLRAKKVRSFIAAFDLFELRPSTISGRAIINHPSRQAWDIVIYASRFCCSGFWRLENEPW